MLKIISRQRKATLPVFTLLVLLLNTPAFPAFAAEEGEHAFPHHHLSVLMGYALERKREEDENAIAIGFDYEYRYQEYWGIGGFGEWLDSDTQRDFTAGATVNWHPVGGWAVFAGPGVEFTPTKDKFLLRAGVGYEFELQNDWTLGAKAIYDLIEGGNQTYVLGIDVGRNF